MDILRLTSGDHGLSDRDGGDWRAALDAWLDGAAPGARVTILVHGYRYAPGHPVHDAHDLIFAPASAGRRPRHLSWPQHLDAPILAFGWPARGSLRSARRAARQAGMALAALSQRIDAAGHGTGFVGHSLGGAAILGAIGALPPGIETRAVLMTPAAFRDEARAALATPAGARARVLNVTARENLVFDALYAAACGRPFAGMLAQGLPDAPATWVDLPIDCVRARQRLSAHGWPIRAPRRAVCHWSAYLRPGLFPIYRAHLSGELTPARLRAILPPGAS